MHEALKSSSAINLNRGSRYHIPVQAALPRLEVPLRLLLVRNDACIHCGICVDACVYGVHERKADLRMPIGVVDQQENVCRTCLRCVRECPKEALSVPRNSEFQRKAFGHWSAEIQISLLKQSETGKIPVSGAGYNGKFAGSGFDGIWTDMSEIVRPTRDGIHGREYISTAIIVGSRPTALRPDRSGDWWNNTVELPVPFLFDLAAFSGLSHSVMESVTTAAQRLNTLVFVPHSAEAYWQNASPFSVPVFSAGHAPRNENRMQQAYMVELEYGEGFYQAFRHAKKVLNGTLLAVRMPFDPERAVELASQGVCVLHLMSQPDGMTPAGHISKALRTVHTALVNAGLRERVTLLAGGSVAAAEHMAKSILCGADGVTLDLTLLTALQVWRGGPPQDGLDRSAEFDAGWGVRRIQNLMASWRDQLLEILGAMGLREVRRLRGEVGRGLFFEDLQKEFHSIFGAPLEMPSPPTIPADRVPQIRSRIVSVPRNFHNELSKFRVGVTADCIQCGVCVHTCPYGVFEMPNGFNRLLPPRSSECIGSSCETKDFYCVPQCPTDAIRIELDETYRGMGDPRWTGDLLISTYKQAESGHMPEDSIESETGASDGGFDRIRIRSLSEERVAVRAIAEDLRTAIPLNRRKKGPQMWIPVPWYGGGMSYGSISLNVMLARAKAARAFGTFMSTGEGGYPDPLIPYANHIITQVATGLFGVREDTIRRSRIIEFKYAQGAKPGLGGHLLADKVTAEVARMRGSLQWSSLFSPFPFHSVYSVEDHKKHLDWIRIVHPDALISVKVSTPSDVDMVAVGSYYAGANILQLDGSYGGTGAAPDIAKKNIAMPIEFAIPKVHKFLMGEGIRDEMVVLASGGIRTPLDIVKSIALGADGVVIGTAELVAIECDRCTNCERGRGCPFGIATSDPELTGLIDPDWAAQRIINMFHSWRSMLIQYLDRLGLNTLLELRGRTDLLEYVDDESAGRRAKV